MARNVEKMRKSTKNKGYEFANNKRGHDNKRRNSNNEMWDLSARMNGMSSDDVKFNSSYSRKRG